MPNGRKKVIVVGGGLGGISAAISLAQQGYDVALYEKNAQIGGKLNVLQAEGYTFDLGPSILTLPQTFERLFERSGKRMADYVSIRPVRPHWRNFFDDGTVVDLYPETERMAEEARKVGEAPEAVESFLAYSERLYDLVDQGYFQEGLDSARDFRRFYGLRNFAQFDMFRTMHGGVAAHVKTRYFRDIFDFFIKYVGSSAYDAPAFMNCLPTIQFRYDLWYVDGGMYNLARGLRRLMEELGIGIHVNSDVKRILTEDSRICGLELSDGERVDGDIFVCNVEVIPAYRDLLQEDAKFMKRLRRLEPSCSGLVLDLGLDRQYPQLAHHNFFFSGDQREHFDTVFRKKELPEDPTIYLVAASRTDPTVAPEGCDCLKILPHIPHIDPERPFTREDYLAFKERIIDKLERMGLEDLRKHVVFEHVWTPFDIEREYRSNQGSIYGVVTDRFKNFAFKAPKQSTRYPNLFFTGASVNPGGGMPMVVQCGQNVSRRVVEWDRS
ncbi:MAG: phytoene desaturase family protein [FCB group bacterium]|jgi:diapolycopene oxygenase|nr:phytoene desaturase family protein [FCB group bacterium]